MTRDVLFLVALPASGKSEIRRYLDHLTQEESAALGLGRLVHLDDYPYVHFMRRASDEAVDRGLPGIFFPSPDQPFGDPREWTVLSLLLAQDAQAVLAGGQRPDDDAGLLLDRIDRIRRSIGMEPIGHEHRADIAAALGSEAASIAAGVAGAVDSWEAGSCTLVVEFARGGPESASMPLSDPYGYRHALSCFDESVVRRASVLYVWVGAQESRRRNRERAVPGRDGDASILHHGVPEAVMREEYGCDDIAWLLDTASAAGTIDVPVGDGVIPVPAARLDNRDDLTSHLRGAPDSWDPDLRAELHRRLVGALDFDAPPVRRFEYIVDLTQFDPDISGAPTEVDLPSQSDAEALAVLMLDAYRGTIDYDGQTMVEARDEVAGFFADAPDLASSAIVRQGDRLVSACLVMLQDEGPLIGYVMTAADRKDRGLARRVLERSLQHLAAAGHDHARAWITEGNLPSETMFGHLGFVRTLSA